MPGDRAATGKDGTHHQVNRHLRHTSAAFHVKKGPLYKSFGKKNMPDNTWAAIFFWQNMKTCWKIRWKI